MQQSVFRKLFDLLLLILIVNAVWRVGPPFYQYFVFRNQVAETARWSTGQSESELKDILLEIARRSDLPVGQDDLIVQRQRQRLLIDVRYVEPLEILPFYTYEYQFRISVDTLLARPSTASDIR
jgi:hypothetical protein